MSDLLLVLWAILNRNDTIAVLRYFPGVVISLIIRLVYPGGNNGLGVEEVYGSRWS